MVDLQCWACWMFMVVLHTFLSANFFLKKMEFEQVIDINILPSVSLNTGSMATETKQGACTFVFRFRLGL